MSDKKCGSTSCDKGSCEGCSGHPQSMLEPLNAYSKIGKVIGVVSGKGGVGKSMMSATLATILSEQGYKVGIMDADITGPSIPRMFGIKNKAQGNEQGIFPEVTEGGIKIMSVNLLLENEEDPVVWRGPIIAGVIKQFWRDVLWGELDYLVVDMPPGTGDVPLTVFQSLPVDGIVIISSPQDLVKMIVKKAFNMAGQMKIPVLGLIENYSYLECPDCGKRISVFGESKIDETARELGVDVLGKMPIIPEITALVDAGDFEKADHSYMQEAVQKIINKTI